PRHRIGEPLLIEVVTAFGAGDRIDRTAIPRRSRGELKGSAVAKRVDARIMCLWMLGVALREHHGGVHIDGTSPELRQLLALDAEVLHPVRIFFTRLYGCDMGNGNLSVAWISLWIVFYI